MFADNESSDYLDVGENNKCEVNQDHPHTISLPQKKMLSSEDGVIAVDRDDSGSHLMNDSFSTSESNTLRFSNKQLKLDLQSEQDIIIQLRKRLNNIEKEKLGTATQTNEEISALKSQLAKAFAQIEKGEAVRHNLDYELAKSNREINQMRQASKNKEDVLIAGTEDLKNKIKDLSDEVKHLQNSLQTCIVNSREQENLLKEDLEDKHQQFLKCRTELDAVNSEKDRLNELFQQHSRVIADLNGKLEGFENEKLNVLDSLRRATNELTYAKEREDRIRSELEVAQSRIKTLEENTEAEQASHLETKFNAEIVQLRVRDLQAAIDVEKSAGAEANKAIERLTQQNRELEQVYEDERMSIKELNKNFDKMEKEHMTIRRQLSSEIEDKKAIIENISKELEVHQKNFNDLKSELTKAKKSQNQLEGTYGGPIKELEFLLQTFHFDDKRLRLAKKEESGGANKGSKANNPAVVVDNFKHILVQLRRKMDSQTEELVKTKKTVERLTKELDSCKELIKTKDKAIEDTQKNYTKAAKDLNKVRSSYSEVESTMSKLKTNLQEKASSKEKDRSRIQELSEEIMKLVKRHRTEEEEKVTFLHGLHQKMLSSHMAVPNKDREVNQVAWDDLTNVVYQQVSMLLELLYATEEKLKASYNSARENHDAMAALKHEHAEQITRLTNSQREREVTWNQQKEDLEKHFNQMLKDLKSRSKKTQAIADQAWEKVRATGSVQQGLESEVIELRRSLAESQVHVSSLLSACALLSGAVYPLYSRAMMLASERHILQHLYTTWENCRERALYLSSVLRSGKESEQDKPERDRKLQRKMRPVLRFRVGVITVLAANRLLSLGSGSAKCFVTYTSTVGDIGLSVSVGGLSSRKRRFAEPQANLKSWLTSPALLKAAVTSMVELQEFVHSKKDLSTPGEARAVVSAARSSFSKFIDQLSQFFPPSAHISSRDCSSLLCRLENQLSHALIDTPVQLKGNLVSSQDLMCGLQNHILNLTQRLHTAEKERRLLLKELNELKNQIGDKNNSAAQENTASNSGKTTKSKYVPMSKFQQVCVELSNALRREQTAQELLQEQSSQLMELTTRLSHCASDGIHKEKDAFQLQECLSEAQNELRYKEQALMQVSKQLEHVQYERNSLQSNLKDAESAMRTSARDKEIIAHYIQNIVIALEMAKKQFEILREPWALTGESSLSRLLDINLIPEDIGHAGPELIAMQNLIGSLIDVQQQAVSKVKSLQEEINSHRSHIDTLKRELNNAVHRDFLQTIEDSTDGAVNSSLDLDSDLMDEFVPLKEVSNAVSSAKVQPDKQISSPVCKSQNSAFHSVKSRSQQTSRKSTSPKEN